MKQILWALSALAGSIPQSCAAESVRVLGQVIVDETRMEGEKIGEFSALVRDPNGIGILGISDRGYVAKLDINIVDGKLVGVVPMSVHVLTAADGSDIRDENFDPEGAVMLHDGTLAIVSEDDPRLALFDLQGRWLRDEVLPVPMDIARQQAKEKDGLESLGWTAASGYISMPEAPLFTSDRDKHTIYSTQHDPVVFSTEGSDDVSVKGLETVGNHLILLERTRDKKTKANQPWLRLVDIKACVGQNACKTQQLPIALDGLADADFEGIVALDDNMFMIVSDDKIDGKLRSAFVLLQLEE